MSPKITWIGHAAFLIESTKGNVLIDPYISDNPNTSYTLSDLPDIDMIIVTHGHQDHIGDTIKIAKQHGALVVGNVEVVRWLQKHGVENIHGQQAGGQFSHPAGDVKLTMAFHASSMPDGSYGGQPNGVLLTVDKKTIYHSGDTGLFSDMKLIGDEGIDLALLPIGDNYTMGPEDAAKAVTLLNPNYVLPMHYNTWSIIEKNPEIFYDLVKNPEVTLLKLDPGDIFHFE